MPTERNLTGKQLGSKVKELFKLIENTPDWDKYVSNKTKKVVECVYKHKSMINATEELGVKYITARSHLMTALNRIEGKKTFSLRGAESGKAKTLFSLMEYENWKNGLSNKEIEIAESYRKYKSFHEVGRRLNMAPANVSGVLYGNTQKLVVINKIIQNNNLDVKALS